MENEITAVTIKKAVCIERLPSLAKEGFLLSSLELNPTSYRLRQNPLPSPALENLQQGRSERRRMLDTHFQIKTAGEQNRPPSSSCLRVTSSLPSVFGKGKWVEKRGQGHKLT